jgi:conjugal transfer pilus assembly protein TraD
LLERALLVYFEHAAPAWRQESERYIELAKDGKLPKPTKTTTDRLVAYVAYYTATIQPTHPSEALDSAISLYMHDRAHVGKMSAALNPVLSMLDSGELGELLSPRYDNIDDHRPVFDSDKVVEGNKVMYFGLDALSDATVSGAVGSIIVSDLAAVAGARYNYSKNPRRITLIIDEASEVVGPQFQQLASKGRGAGFTLWAASQTIPDYIARLGSSEKALSALGNFNNLVCLRIKDATTCLFVSEQFGNAFVDSRSFGLSTSTASDATLTGFTGGETSSMQDKLIEVIPPDMLGMLPNHEYFALLAGGKLYKGRQPVVQ